jgi:hypothetical protein
MQFIHLSQNKVDLIIENNVKTLVNCSINYCLNQYRNRMVYKTQSTSIPVISLIPINVIVV